MRKILFAVAFVLCLGLVLPQGAVAKDWFGALFGKKTEQQQAAPGVPQPAAPQAPTGPTGATSNNNIKITDVGHSSLSGKGVLDIYATITNLTKMEETLTDAEAPAEKVMLVTIEDGKETEVPFSLKFNAEEKIVLKEGEKFLRLYGVDKKATAAGNVGVYFHFRHAPSAQININLSGKNAK